MTVSGKGMSSRRYDQSPDLREFDTFKGVLEWTRNACSPMVPLACGDLEVALGI
jgi:hypothetical protein